jgi:hypothetical protein
LHVASVIEVFQGITPSPDPICLSLVPNPRILAGKCGWHSPRLNFQYREERRSRQPDEPRCFSEYFCGRRDSSFYR